jgi:hypothetical protein
MGRQRTEMRMIFKIIFFFISGIFYTGLIRSFVSLRVRVWVKVSVKVSVKLSVKVSVKVSVKASGKVSGKVP